MTQQLDLFSAAPAGSPDLRTSAPPPGRPTAPVTLADVLASYEDAASDHPRRVQLRSAIRRLGKVLRLPLETAPACVLELRPLIQRANPALAGIKPRRWISIKSIALAALREAGVDVLPSRSSTAFSPTWTELMASVEDRGIQIGLSRFVRHLSQAGVDPDQVTLETFEAFRTELAERSLLNAERAYPQTVRHWNKAVSTVPDWPAVRPPPVGDPRRFSKDWHELPPPFVQDVEGFLNAKANTDPLSDDYTRPTRAATARGRRKSLRAFASAVILSGQVPVEQMLNLEVLTRLENVRAGLRYLRDVRAGGKVTESQINHAWLLRTIAKYWVKDESRVEELKVLINNLTAHVRGGRGKGMTAKNRERLLQFAIPANVEALIDLPDRVRRAVGGKGAPSNSESVRVMRALQVGILTFIPMRSKNLALLEIGTNIIDMGKGSKRAVRIHLPAESTKNYRDYTAPLPRHLFPLLDAWLQIHRTRISPRPSPYLFPNPTGEARSRDSLSGKLTDFIRRETGLVINAHLFRHIAAKLYLDRFPDGMEIVRQLLGHKDIKTTMAFYAELQQDPAFARLEKALLDIGYELPDVTKPSKRGRS